jgi:hypothetical protein
LDDPGDRDVVRRYIRWHHLRRMQTQDSVSQGMFLRSKQTVTVAIDFVIWLREHDTDLAGLTQARIDDWQATGPSTRESPPGSWPGLSGRDSLSRT